MSVLHIVLVLCCVLIVCCGIVFALFCFVFLFVFCFPFFVSFLVCFVCLRLMFCVPNIANVCHCIVQSWLSLRFSLTFILYIYLFIIRDSKVVIVIIATFVQPDNRRRVCRNQSGNQKPYFERQTTTKRTKGQKMMYKTLHRKHRKDRVTRTPLNTGDELGCIGRVNRSFSTSYTPLALLQLQTRC